MVKGAFSPSECDWISRALVAVAWTDGNPTFEQLRILKVVCEELGLHAEIEPPDAPIREPLRRMSEGARLFLGDVAVVLANIDADCASGRLWIRDALALSPVREKDMFARTQAARHRIQQATRDFLHEVRRLASEPLGAYLSAVARLDALKRQVLRETMGLS